MFVTSSPAIWIMAFARSSAFAVTAPMAGSRSVPSVMRAALAIALVPVVTAHEHPAIPSTPERLALRCIGELAIGASFGLAASLIAASAAAAGSLIDATLAVRAFGGEPVFGAADGPFSRTLALAFGWCFVAGGALTHLCARFAEASADVVPSARLATNAVTLVRASIEASLTLATPAVAGQLLSTLVAATAARAAPRINGLVLSAPIATTVVLLIVLAGAGRVLEALLRLAAIAAAVKPL